MDFKILVTVFEVFFLAELGDKTQPAALLFASKSAGNLTAVFIGASAALVLASAIGIAAGGLIAQHAHQKLLSYPAGAGFLIIGARTIWRGAG